MDKLLKRLIKIDSIPHKTFFLWGQRQSGKSTLIRTTYPKAIVFDFLKNDVFTKYVVNPHLLREELVARNGPNEMIVLDEIQKVPALLDEVHWLIENRGLHFGLCGSSARKLKRQHSNLLGGRALRYELYGLVCRELEELFDLEKILNRGYLPSHYLSEHYLEFARSYVADYLKQEVADEGLVRNLQTFSNFLDHAAACDTEVTSFSTFGRDCGVSGNTIQEYYQILQDTLIGSFLPAYRKPLKRRQTKSPKFFFHDVGVVNILSKRGFMAQGSPLFGKAFENWIFHELLSYSRYSRKMFEISYWQIGNTAEVDFILNDLEVAIECKSSVQIHNDHLKGLRELAKEKQKIKKRLVVSCVDKMRETEDGIVIYPYLEFVNALWDGHIA